MSVHPRLVLLILISFMLPLRAAEPYITEFLADNDGGLVDGDGDHPDWIEIYNPNPVTTSIEGWYLTDDLGNFKQWQFPPGQTINANSYLIVFASGKDRRVLGQELHTHFRSGPWATHWHS